MKKKANVNVEKSQSTSENTSINDGLSQLITKNN